MWFQIKKQKDPVLAIELCREIIKESPKSKLAALAQFQIAKVYREELSDIESSLKEFIAFTKRYTKSSIMDDVMWEIGLIYEEENNLEEALRIYNELIGLYSFSNYREIAQAHIESIHWRQRRVQRSTSAQNK